MEFVTLDDGKTKVPRIIVAVDHGEYMMVPCMASPEEYFALSITVQTFMAMSGSGHNMTEAFDNMSENVRKHWQKMEPADVPDFLKTTTVDAVPPMEGMDDGGNNN